MKLRSLLLTLSLTLCSVFFAEKLRAQDVVIKWSPKMDQFVLGYYKTMANEMGLQSAVVTKISNCMLEQLKIKFPKGLSTSKEKFGEINEELAKKCVTGMVMTVPWNDSNKAHVKKRFIEQLPSDMPVALKQQIATCFIGKYIAKYPNGVATDPSSIAAQKADFKAIALTCAEEVQ